MGLKPNFTQQEVHKVMLDKLKWMENAIISRFMYVGETFVNNARANGTYTDQTGNLRSGICYIVAKDGKRRSPSRIPSQSKKMIDELLLKYSKGYVLIVGTGMGYAAAVESRGKDVITGSSITAKAQLSAALKSITK